MAYTELEAVEKVIEGLAGGFEYLDCGWEYAVKKIKEIPTADVVPVRHGSWCKADCFTVGNKRYTAYQCSMCSALYQDAYLFNYCPNCGSIMDGSEEER